MHMILDLEDNKVDITVSYSQRRKTLAIIITPPGFVRVIAPAAASRKFIVESISKRAAWIILKLEEVKLKNACCHPKQYCDGEVFLYRGEEYRLNMAVDLKLRQARVRLGQGEIEIVTPSYDPEVVKQALELWYRTKATEYIKTRIEHYQPVINAKPGRITIRNQRTRWGSCSSRGNLNFNWRIMMAPCEVVDYLVVHEMCHLLQPDHSPRFWGLVKSIMPEYASKREWLKSNGLYLTW